MAEHVVHGGETEVDGCSSVWAVDISEPYNPWIVEGTDTPGRVTSIVVSEDYIYVADGDTGLLVLSMWCDAVPFPAR